MRGKFNLGNAEKHELKKTQGWKMVLLFAISKKCSFFLAG
jgi:hypothetical protein